MEKKQQCNITTYCDKLTIMYCRTILGAWPAFVFSLVYIALLTLVIEQVSHS